MKTVWLVTEIEHGDKNVKGVYSTCEKAHRAKSKLPKHDCAGNKKRYIVDEFIVDPK